MTVISANDLALLRKDRHVSKFYLSFLRPHTLWEARVNSGALEDGDTLIPFDGGFGTQWTAVEPYQTLWVGSTQGAHDIGVIRIRSIVSGDGGATGTLTVAAQHFPWVDNLYLTFIHNYQLWAVYPYIDPDTEEFYKDRDVPWTTSDRPPVPILSLSSKAGFIRNGSFTFFVNASNSYAIQSGTTIVDYTLSVYPTFGVTVDFNTSTGLGSVKVTYLGQEYYWLKLTVLDDNGNSQSTWRCVFAHNPDPAGDTHPITEFSINQVVRSIGRGGTFAQVIVNQEDLSDVPGRTFAVLWKESAYGKEMELGNSARMVAAGDKIYVNPSLGYDFTNHNLPFCEADFTFTAGVLLDGEPAPDGTTCNIELTASGIGGPVAGSANTTGGVVSITISSGSSINCSGTATIEDTDASVNILANIPYSYLSSPTPPADQQYPSPLWVFPHHLAVGYLYRSRAIAELSRGVNNTTMDIVSVEEYLRREFQFSVSLTSDETPSTWYEFPNDELTIGEALFHLYHYHSTLFQIADVAGLNEDDMDLNYATDFEEGTLYGMAESMYTRVRRVLSTDRNGNLRFIPIINLLTDAERAALDTTMTITNADKGTDLNFVQRYWKPAAFAYVSGIYFDGTIDDSGNPTAEAYCSIAPGPVPEEGGEAIVRLERQTLRSQAHVNELSGRLLARENRSIEEVVVLFHGDYSDFLEPKNDFWAIDDDHNNIGLSWVGQKLIPDTITIQADVKNGTVTCYGFFEPEVESRDGITTECLSFPVDTGGIPDDIPPGDIPGDGFGTVYVMVEATLGRTRDFSAAFPAWVSIAGSASGDFYDFILDPWDPIHNGILLTSAGVYLSTNLDLASPTWTLKLSLAQMESATGASGTLSKYYQIKGCIAAEGFFAMGVEDWSNGVYAKTWVFTTTDYGDNWTANLVYSAIWGTAARAARYSGGIEVSTKLSGSGQPIIYLQTGPTLSADNALDRVWRSTNGGTSWTQMSVGATVGGQALDIHCPYNNNADSLILLLTTVPGFAGVGNFSQISYDGGASWTTVSGGSGPHGNSNASFNRTPFQTFTEDRLQIYAFSSTEPPGSHDHKEFWVSTDGAATWSHRSTLANDSIAAGGFPYNSGQFYVVTNSITTGFILVSIDGGVTWMDKTGDWSFGATVESPNCGAVIVPNWLAED